MDLAIGNRRRSPVLVVASAVVSGTPNAPTPGPMNIQAASRFRARQSGDFLSTLSL
jgi:hypothetical protein